MICVGKLFLQVSKHTSIHYSLCRNLRHIFQIFPNSVALFHNEQISECISETDPPLVAMSTLDTPCEIALLRKLWHSALLDSFNHRNSTIIFSSTLSSKGCWGTNGSALYTGLKCSHSIACWLPLAAAFNNSEQAGNSHFDWSLELPVFFNTWTGVSKPELVLRAINIPASTSTQTHLTSIREHGSVSLCRDGQKTKWRLQCKY